ncbi:DUF6114 domain-containing protein [Streptomyces sp. BI20]|uniref:DUF6114 domain-containing protein n=1 Tax=Streptomyces sp. BI20 TaxID=3403460 RepID=UPI003C70EC91
MFLSRSGGDGGTRDSGPGAHGRGYRRERRPRPSLPRPARRAGPADPAPDLAPDLVAPNRDTAPRPEAEPVPVPPEPVVGPVAAAPAGGGRALRAALGARVEAVLPWPGPRARLRAWRRTRPFWGGLLVLLAGAELLLVPLSPLPILISLGLGGIAALGIGAALLLAGLFLWLLPQARAYVAVHAVLLSVVAFVVTNLGGFVIGTLLGIAGGSLAFGWTPDPDPDLDSAPGPGPARGRRRRRPGPALLVLPPALALLASVLGPRPAHAAPAPGTPRAPRVPPTVTTSLFAPRGFALAGVTEVETADGPLRVLVLRMRAASLRDYRLGTRDADPGRYGLAADSLELTGEVTLYLTRFSGCIEGLVCVTFSPDGLPAPPVIPPFVFMTKVSAEQALVTADTIRTEGLRLDAA